MATVAARQVAAAATGPAVDYRFSVEQFHRMIDAGVFGADERCELLEGVVVRKMTRNPPHDGCLYLAQTELLARLPAGWVLRVQSAVTLPDSEPEPDLVVAAGPARQYVRRHPGPRDVGLIVEVADATLAEDRDRKSRVYARARVPMYWIINLIESQVEVYTQPRAGRSPSYRRRQDFAPGDDLPLVLTGREVARVSVRELLP
jgi:Uma2 family endonuclease